MYPDYLLFFAYLFMLLFIFSFRFIVGKILSKAGYLTIPVLLVGAGKTAELVKKSLDRMPIATYKIIGYMIILNPLLLLKNIHV